MRSSARHSAQLLTCAKTSCACSGGTSSSTAKYNRTVAQAEGPHTLPISGGRSASIRSEEHTSELQSHLNLACRLLLEKKKNTHDRKSLLYSVGSALVAEDGNEGRSR